MTLNNRRCGAYVAPLVVIALGLLLRPAPALAQSNTATITSPANGAVNVDVLQPIQWTAIQNVQAYYLYVGTSFGAKDLVNSGEIQQTSYLASNLPSGQTLYVRISTKVGGVWRFSDSTFTAAPVQVSALTFPVNGATNADLTQPIQWTSIAGAQAYYLYVGTTPGGKTLVDSGETQQLSYMAPNVPGGQTLYARIHTKIAGVWWYRDSTFTAAASLASILTYPLNGASNADLTQPIQWSTVPGVQAYYLYVGTSLGAKDLVNTGETLQTSYLAGDLPSGQTLYARMNTKVGGVWRFRDSTFTAAPSASLRATITYPANGTANADLSLPITWTSVPNVQAYYLYVGTSVGAKNLVDSGETLQTSYLAANLPIGQTLYVRISTKVGGVWRFRDSTFTAVSQAQLIATFTSPANGATGVDPMQPFTWTSIANVQAYYLYVGTSVGAKDLVNTGEIQQTSWVPGLGLPANQTLYARIHTKVGGVWRSSSITFTAAMVAARITDPVDGATNVDRTRPVTWTPVPNAQAYYLYVGTAPGLNDVVDSYETQQTSFSIAHVPVNRTLYARLHTKYNGHWYYTQSTFIAEPLAAEFTYPLDGAASVSLGQPFQWTPAIGGQSYKLWVGTTPGGSDLLDSGTLAGLSYSPATLPATGTLYARLWTMIGGSWTRHTDIAFTLDASALPATIVFPFNGQLGIDAGQPFEWQDVPLARGYRLSIGTTFGGHDLHDSGVIRATRRFVFGLPVGPLLYGRIETEIAGQWQVRDFTFTVDLAFVSIPAQIVSAQWATNRVRMMAFDDNRASGTSELFDLVSPKYQALCTDFSVMLMQLMSEMNIQLSTRFLNVTFNGTPEDAHTLVEMFDPQVNRWMLLDPTFDLTIFTANGLGATATEVSTNTRAFDWTSLTYQYLGAAGDAYARAYYLDYPLLFLNFVGAAPMTSPAPYLQPLSIPASAGPGGGLFVIRCTSGNTTQAVINGATQTITCGGTDSTTFAFWAASIAAPSGGATFELYTVRRYKF